MNEYSAERDYLQLDTAPMNRGVVHGHIHNYNNLTYIHGHIHKKDNDELEPNDEPDNLNCSKFQDCQHFEYVHCHASNSLKGESNGMGVEEFRSVQGDQEDKGTSSNTKLLMTCWDKDHELLPTSISQLDFLDCHLTCEPSILEGTGANKVGEEFTTTTAPTTDLQHENNQVGINGDTDANIDIYDGSHGAEHDDLLLQVDPSSMEINSDECTPDEHLLDKLCFQSDSNHSLNLSKAQHHSHSHILNTPNDMKVLNDLSAISNLYESIHKPGDGVDLRNDHYCHYDHDSINLLHSTLCGHETKLSANFNQQFNDIQFSNSAVVPSEKQYTTPSTINFNWIFNTHDESIPCEWNGCSHSFDNLLDLQSHLIKSHVPDIDQNNFDCQWRDCDFNTTDFGSIVNHVNNQHGIGFDAKIIDDATIAKQVAGHIIPHEDPSPHVCKWNCCNQIFDSCKELNEHMESVHIPSGLSSYTCEWDGCGKKFIQKQKLIRHLKVHSKYKPFKCPECGKCFNTQDILTQHLRVHSGEKPFKCRLCPKSYSTSSSLRVHIRTHTGEKPLHCPICHKRFNESSNLTKHIKIHQRDKK